MTKSLALLLLTALMLPLSFAAERETRVHEKTVDISDPALRSVITEHLKKPPDATITTRDLAVLTTLTPRAAKSKTSPVLSSQPNSPA